jgi:hypothetical protein
MAPSTSTSTTRTPSTLELHHQQQQKLEQAEEMAELQALSKRVRHRSIVDGKSTYFGKYVSFEASEKLRTYEYHGTDHSLIYKHVLTPMNNFLVELLPLWLAPNLVSGGGRTLEGGAAPHLISAET